MSHSIDEYYSDYEETPRCAESDELHCSACREPIQFGHVYYDILIVEGDPDDEDSRSETSLIRCLRCQRIHQHLRELGDGEMWPDEHLNCGEEYEEHWNKPPPSDIAELAFKSGADLQTPELQAEALALWKGELKP